MCKIWNWIVYTLVFGALPFIVRIFLYEIFPLLKIDRIVTVDFLTFSLVIITSCLNEYSNLKKNIKTESSIINHCNEKIFYFLLIFVIILIFADLIPMKEKNDSLLFWAAVVIAVVSAFIGLFYIVSIDKLEKNLREEEDNNGKILN